MKRSVIALLCLWLANCGLVNWLGGKEIKRSYCDQYPENTECHQDHPDADTTCKSNADCLAPTPVCDLAGSRACVQCVAPDETAACTGTTPACAADHTCQACRVHPDCPLSLACMPDGSCAAADQVAYVDPMTGSGTVCSKGSPCKQVTDALKTARPIVKLTGMIDEPVQITDQTVTLLADPGTQLTRTTTGVILTINGTSVVTIVDLAIANGAGATGIGVSLPAGNSASLSLLRASLANNTGGGISVTGGTVTISQSSISDNLANGLTSSGGRITISRSFITGNIRGGLSISESEFDITNCIIANNGGLQTSIGGVLLSQTNTGTRRFAFNTVTGNTAADGQVVGVACTVITTAMTLSSNIIYNPVLGTRTQVGGANCTWAFSDIGPDTVTGNNIINADPLFTNPLKNDFHLQPTSPAKDKAQPDATISADIDGDARPQGSGFDIGADEVK